MHILRGYRSVNVCSSSWRRRSTARLWTAPERLKLSDECHLTSSVGERWLPSSDSRKCVPRRAHRSYLRYLLPVTGITVFCHSRSYSLWNSLLKQLYTTIRYFSHLIYNSLEDAFCFGDGDQAHISPVCEYVYLNVYVYLLTYLLLATPLTNLSYMGL